MKMEIEHRIA